MSCASVSRVGVCVSLALYLIVFGCEGCQVALKGAVVSVCIVTVRGQVWCNKFIPKRL